MIEFSGIDVVAQRQMSDVHVRRALAAALGVPEQRAALIDDMIDYPDPGAADVVCVSSPVGGEFASLLSIQTGRLELPYGTHMELVQRLCDLLQTQCLVPHADVDPYVMWLIAPGASPRKVALDPTALDEGRYLIAHC